MDAKDQAAIQALADLAPEDVALAKKLVADFKAGGVKKIAAEDLAAVVAEAQKNYTAVLTALPAVKAGYKTTEFWMVAGVLLGNAIYTGATSKVLPLDLNATLTALVAIYTVVRGLVKKSPAPAPLPPA